MTAVVVFESMFGNTQQIADAVSEGLAQHLRVEQVELSAAPAQT
jgi:flavodoxin